MMGMTAVNVDPTPSSLSTCTRPPSSSASLRQSGRPRPVPLHAALQRAVDLRELLEDQLVVLRRDADAGVGDRKRDRARRRQRCARRHADLAALGELERVRDEVAQDLRDLRSRRCTAAAGRPARRRPAPPIRSPAAGAACRAARRTARPTSNSIGRTSILPGLDLGEVEQVVHQLGRALGRLADEADLPLLLGAQVAVGPVEQQARERLDRVDAASGTRGSCSRGSAS